MPKLQPKVAFASPIREEEGVDESREEEEEEGRGSDNNKDGAECEDDVDDDDEEEEVKVVTEGDCFDAAMDAPVLGGLQLSMPSAAPSLVTAALAPLDEESPLSVDAGHVLGAVESAAARGMSAERTRFLEKMKRLEEAGLEPGARRSDAEVALMAGGSGVAAMTRRGLRKTRRCPTPPCSHVLGSLRVPERLRNCLALLRAPRPQRHGHPGG